MLVEKQRERCVHRKDKTRKDWEKKKKRKRKTKENRQTNNSKIDKIRNSRPRQKEKPQQHVSRMQKCDGRCTEIHHIITAEIPNSREGERTREKGRILLPKTPHKSRVIYFFYLVLVYIRGEEGLCEFRGHSNEQRTPLFCVRVNVRLYGRFCIRMSLWWFCEYKKLLFCVRVCLWV